MVQVLDESTFDEHVGASDVPVLVDFWASWCGPCTAMAPVLDRVATDTDGHLSVAKVDVDAHPGLARRFAVQSIPTLVVLVDGVEQARYVGARSDGQLREELGAFLP